VSDYSDLSDQAAERQWLGAVWHSHGRVLDDTTISADDLVNPAHQRLHAAFTAMAAAGTPYDPAGLMQALGDDLSRCQAALTEVVTSGAVPQSAGWHANTLTRLSAHRRTVEAATRIAQAADGERDTDELAEFARAQLDAADTDTHQRDTRTWADVLTQSLDRWQTPVTDAIATGWADLDDMLSGGGLRPGHLTVVGARPGVGKSLVATMLAGRTAAANRGVYFASVEMSTDELTDRIAAAATGVNLADLTNRTLNDQQLEDLRRGVSRIKTWPLHIDDRASAINHVRRGARRAARAPGGLGLILIDYLQIMDGKAAPGTSREQVVAGMSRALKLLSKELHVPVVVLSQLKRPGDRAEKRPLLTDLRESGAVEQDADEVILLHRDDNDPDLAGKIELNLAKNRHGRVGTVQLRWQPYISRITDIAHHHAA
jgi:replicative DNA helicase